MHMPDHGKVLFTVSNEDKEEAIELARHFYEMGYFILATQGTAKRLKEADIPVQVIQKRSKDREETILEVIMSGQVDLVVNTMGKDIDAVQDGFVIRKASIEKGVPLMTSLDTVSAIISVLESRTFLAEAL